MGPQILKTFSSCPIESILPDCITAWFGHCAAKHDTNAIFKFADDTTVLGLITDKTAYREVRDLAVWCQDNNLNVMKTKGDDCGLQEKEDRAHAPSHQWGSKGAG